MDVHATRLYIYALTRNKNVLEVKTEGSIGTNVDEDAASRSNALRFGNGWRSNGISI